MVAPNGKTAVANARQHNRYEVGMCQKFVRGEAWKIGSLYGSAIEAWNGAMYKHKGDRKPPLGAPMFYKGGQYGHVVINSKAFTANIRGTDMPSSGVVGEDVIAWIENHWGYTYLGWTEDLNGVRLPLDKKNNEDDMNQEDFDKIRKIVREEVWEKSLPVNAPDGHETKKKAKQMLREILQRVQK